jgi:hypothetical protein
MEVCLPGPAKLTRRDRFVAGLQGGVAIEVEARLIVEGLIAGGASESKPAERAGGKHSDSARRDDGGAPFFRGRGLCKRGSRNLAPFLPRKQACQPVHWDSSLPENASIHCVLEMKNSSDEAGFTFSMRMGKTALFLLTARSTSRATKIDWLLSLDSTMIRQCEVLIPLMISSP